MSERTLMIIKPDAISRRLTGEILSRIESEGFRICGMKWMRLNHQEAGAFYAEHQGKPFYEPLIRFMTSGPCVPVVLQREDAINTLRRIVGVTDPAEAIEGTLRREFGENVRRNSVHASDSLETASREIGFFFSEDELHPD